MVFDRSPWFQLECVPDPQLGPDEVAVPRGIESLSPEAEVWCAPIDAPFFGAKLRRVAAAGSLARLSTAHPLGPELFANGLIVRAVHENFVSRFAGVRDIADGRIARRPSAEAMIGLLRLMPKARVEELITGLRELALLEALGLSLAAGALSPSLDAFATNTDRAAAIAEYRADLAEVRKLYDDGLITDGERYDKSVDLGSSAAERIGYPITRALRGPLRAMLEAGAITQRELRLLIGATGLLSRANGELCERPIFEPAAEGRSAQDHFRLAQSARGAALRRADQHRKAQELWIELSRAIGAVTVTIEDCGARGAWFSLESFSWRAAGRTAAKDVVDPSDPSRVLARAGRLLDQATIDLIQSTGIKYIAVRYLPFCRAERGVCARCYGRDPATGAEARIGARAGAFAARAITEISAQLMERFYTVCGGVYGSSCGGHGYVAAKTESTVRYVDAEIAAYGDVWVVINGSALLRTIDEEGAVIEEALLPRGARVSCADGEEVRGGEVLAQWQPWAAPVFADLPPEVEAEVAYLNMEGALVETLDEITGLDRAYVERVPDPAKPPSIVLSWSEDGVERARVHPLAESATISARPGAKVRAGEQIAMVPARQLERSFDLWGGIDAFIGLLRAEPTPNPARIARIGGRVKILSKRRIELEDDDGRRVIHRLRGTVACVRNGDRVLRGEALEDLQRDHRELLEILGRDRLCEHLDEEIYARLTTVVREMCSQHGELVARAMTEWVEIVDPGDSGYVAGELVSRFALRGEVSARPVLLGVCEVASRR